MKDNTLCKIRKDHLQYNIKNEKSQSKVENSDNNSIVPTSTQATLRTFQPRALWFLTSVDPVYISRYSIGIMLFKRLFTVALALHLLHMCSIIPKLHRVTLNISVLY